MTNLKSHLIIRISKGQAIDGKRETNRRGYEKMKIGYVRVSKQEQHEVLQWENRTGNTCLIPTSEVEYKVD